MMVTLKRIDAVSAMRVGAFVYALMFTIFCAAVGCVSELDLERLEFIGE